MHSIPSLGWAAILWCFSNNAVATPLWPRISDTQPIVKLGYAQYQGKTLSSGVNQYLGMRFAAPPIGDLRFRAPTSPLPGAGVQNATSVSIPERTVIDLQLI
jgi:hypothetical protein